MAENAFAGAELTIDLDAIAANWRSLSARLEVGARAGAVIKADAYGLGAEKVAPALHAAGCRDFFTASLDEAIALRAVLSDCRIAVFFGPAPGEAGEYACHRLIPVLNHLGQVEAWRNEVPERAGNGSCSVMLHVDTGMSRLGLPPEEAARLAAEPERLLGLEVCAVMSHMACADEPAHPMNGEQLNAFRNTLDALRRHVPTAEASLANSSAIFLGGEYHFDLARPGAALWGLNPTPEKPNPMAEVVRLQGKIMQVRRVDSLRSVGYGAAHVVTRPSRIATVPVGYADGFLRSASNRASGYVRGVRVPVVGRVSMDMLMLDVTDLPEEHARVGETVDLIGGPHSADALAAEAGTIGYEILTSLGRRYRRRYVGGNGAQGGKASS
jgi:alanine racemase